ncbi:hypothetical protein Pmar_PMAR022411 [Perkinsus marinus ATCC 50983]|uniref:Uncharacterized protein n=1 Tax=Perkinsus marinus (strain ATCC 50983 / TXsc) TaxID=423536 RepID=C5LRH5_PERM5|nr:hypothetical protein Pmar_PMAR022411 [Perkinsus marinus ATCC 50983]EER00669.1 hypothetical protein Pmar_PMAR022411 [Perkinsus marinus ATCC 50983]|eukprot:XP_002767951.1 hypothetical protein Pmar_PMAR022411 [Perkinsus marinus ATCC 50983]
MDMLSSTDFTVRAVEPPSLHPAARRASHPPSPRYIGRRKISACSGRARLATVPETSQVVMPDVRTPIIYDDDDCLVNASDIRDMVRRCMVRACIQVTSR